MVWLIDCKKDRHSWGVRFNEVFFPFLDGDPLAADMTHKAERISVGTTGKNHKHVIV
jgi:hypothetical protein